MLTKNEELVHLYYVKQNFLNCEPLVTVYTLYTGSSKERIPQFFVVSTSLIQI